LTEIIIINIIKPIGKLRNNCILYLLSRETEGTGPMKSSNSFKFKQCAKSCRVFLEDERVRILMHHFYPSQGRSGFLFQIARGLNFMENDCSCFETKTVHGSRSYQSKTGAVSVPIYQSATFQHPALGESTGYDYSRLKNPTRPLMKVSDIKAISEIADRYNIITIVDNTFLSPHFQRPLALGADIVVHSGTKFLGGHNDTLAGFVVAKDDKIIEKLRLLHKSIGAVLSPFDSWLILRGIKTLPIRMANTGGKRVEFWY
jgi:hypothetical protein